MLDAGDSIIWVIDGKERNKKDCEDTNLRAWNMHPITKIQYSNIVASAKSVARILKY